MGEDFFFFKKIVHHVVLRYIVAKWARLVKEWAVLFFCRYLKLQWGFVCVVLWLCLGNLCTGT